MCHYCNLQVCEEHAKTLLVKFYGWVDDRHLGNNGGHGQQWGMPICLTCSQKKQLSEDWDPTFMRLENI